jgi:hypothetical protein
MKKAIILGISRKNEDSHKMVNDLMILSDYKLIA